MHQNDRYTEEHTRDEGTGGEKNASSADLMNQLNREIEALTALTAQIRTVTTDATGARQTEPPREANPPQNGSGDRGTTVDLIGFAFHVFERFWLVALAAIVGTVGAWFYARNNVPIYSATSKLYIVSPKDALISFSDLQLGAVLTPDYQELFRTWEVHEMVRQELNLPYSYAQMQSMISVSNPEDTRVLYLTAYNADPQLAASIANAYARAAKVFITETMRGEEPSDFSIALVPSVPMSSSTRSTIIKGFLLGTVLMLGLLFAQYLFDNRPQTPEDIHHYGGIPTLAILPSVKNRRRSEHSSKSAPSSR